jgi:hypothetical protein
LSELRWQAVSRTRLISSGPSDGPRSKG